MLPVWIDPALLKVAARVGFYTLLWYTFSIGITFYNKWLFQWYGSRSWAQHFTNKPPTTPTPPPRSPPTPTISRHWFNTSSELWDSVPPASSSPVCDRVHV
jgi:hypothetical protein